MPADTPLVELTTHKVGGYNVERSYIVALAVACPTLDKAKLEERLQALLPSIRLELTKATGRAHDNTWAIVFAPRLAQHDPDLALESISESLNGIAAEVNKAMSIQSALDMLEDKP